MKTRRTYPFCTSKQSRGARMLTIPVTIATLGLCLLQASAQTTNVVQNFEGFANSAALNAAISSPTANTTVTLGMTNGVNGSKGMIFQGNNAESPYFSQCTLNMTPFSLNGVLSITIAVKGIGSQKGRAQPRHGRDALHRSGGVHRLRRLCAGVPSVGHLRPR